ncbi:MAG: hypothetical protein NZ518_01625 [Dehalococcoidia bacterium]|nr:hypothetical protein [Dehalococcoidia bacterium]
MATDGDSDRERDRTIALIEAEGRRQASELARHETVLRELTERLRSIDERLARWEIRAEERDAVRRWLAALIGALAATVVWATDVVHRVTQWFHRP